MFRLFAAFAFAAATLAGTPAFARAQEVPTVQVATADLDLTRPAGVRALDRRLAAAVREVCPAPFATVLRGVLDQHVCLRIATRFADQGRARLLARAGNAPVGLVAAR